MICLYGFALVVGGDGFDKWVKTHENIASWVRYLRPFILFKHESFKNNLREC